MKVINIAGEEYSFEFTFEASLYNECTEKVAGLMASLMEAGSKEDIKGIVSSLSDIPQTTLSMFYAGLLENHGADGDRTVLSKKAAKVLLKKYLKEHEDDETGNFYGVMQIMIECMADDGFFKRIGLEQMMDAMNGETEEEVPEATAE